MLGGPAPSRSKEPRRAAPRRGPAAATASHLTVTGLLTGCTFDSSTSTSFTCNTRGQRISQIYALRCQVWVPKECHEESRGHSSRRPAHCGRRPSWGWRGRRPARHQGGGERQSGKARRSRGAPRTQTPRPADARHAGLPAQAARQLAPGLTKSHSAFSSSSARYSPPLTFSIHLSRSMPACHPLLPLLPAGCCRSQLVPSPCAGGRAGEGSAAARQGGAGGHRWVGRGGSSTTCLPAHQLCDRCRDSGRLKERLQRLDGALSERDAFLCHEAPTF